MEVTWVCQVRVDVAYNLTHTGLSLTACTLLQQSRLKRMQTCWTLLMTSLKAIFLDNTVHVLSCHAYQSCIDMQSLYVISHFLATTLTAATYIFLLQAYIAAATTTLMTCAEFEAWHAK